MGEMVVDLFFGHAQGLGQFPGIVDVFFQESNDFLADGAHNSFTAEALRAQRAVFLLPFAETAKGKTITSQINV